MAAILSTIRTTVLALLAFTVLLGVVYPAAVTGIAQLIAPAAANGSLVRIDGQVVGSALLGQSFTDSEGNALPEWFQSRPSATSYDASASGGSNLGPENPDLVAMLDERLARIAAREQVPVAEIPADAVTASASGLDPHISPAYALLQVARVARERGLDEDDVRALVESMIQSRDLGYLGEPTVNVLALNIALAGMD